MIIDGAKPEFDTIPRVMRCIAYLAKARASCTDAARDAIAGAQIERPDLGDHPEPYLVVSGRDGVTNYPPAWLETMAHEPIFTEPCAPNDPGNGKDGQWILACSVSVVYADCPDVVAECERVQETVGHYPFYAWKPEPETVAHLLAVLS